MKKLLIIFVVAIIIHGCAVKYQSSGTSSLKGSGFSETQLDENIFKVIFRGNEYTQPERTADFALMRCAELTLKKGYKYFVIIESDKYTSSRPYLYGGHIYSATKPSSTNTIVCFKEKPNSGFSYNANFVCINIAEKYGLVKK